MVINVNWRASFSFVIGIKVVYVLHFNLFKIPEWRAWGAAAEDGAYRCGFRFADVDCHG